MDLDICTMDRLVSIHQEERAETIMSVIRVFHRIGVESEMILKNIMEGFQITHDKANQYMKKAFEQR